MLSSRCLCLRAVRPVITPTVAYRPAPSARPLHHSAPLFKKAKASRHEEAEEFEEFEEDQFDEGLEELSPDNAPGARVSGRADTGLSMPERYSLRLPAVNAALAGSHFKLRSHIPSSRSLVTLINLTTPETVDTSLGVLAKWRARGLEPIAGDSLVKKLVKFRQPQTIIDLLEDRTRYGVELKDIRGLDSCYADLSKIGAAERADPSLVRSRLEQAKRLNDIIKFYSPDSADPIGPLTTLAPALLLANSSAATAEDKSAANALLTEAMLYAPEEVETVVLDEVRSSKVKRLIASRVVTIREELEKLGGQDEALRWVQQVEQSLAPYMKSSKA